MQMHRNKVGVYNSSSFSVVRFYQEITWRQRRYELSKEGE